MGFLGLELIWSVDISHAAKLPLDNVELDTGEEDSLSIACLLDIGSELTLAGPKLKCMPL